MKTLITRENYSLWMDDYLDGKLDEPLTESFIGFLHENPDLAVEPDFFKSTALKAEFTPFSKKELLYHHRFDAEDEFNQAAISITEGMSEENEKVEFDSYLSLHPEKKGEFEIFLHTRLVPDSSVIFRHKHKLYRKEPRKVYFNLFQKAAAVVAFLVLAESISHVDPGYFQGKTHTGNIAQTENKLHEVKPGIKQPQKAGIIRSKPNPVQHATINNLADLSETEPNSNILSAVNQIVADNSNFIPAKMEAINARVNTGNTQQQALNLSMDNQPSSVLEGQPNETLLADLIKEKTGLEKLSFHKIGKSGLDLISQITKNKFTYQTNNEGKLTKVELDSKILAFSIPFAAGKE